VRRRKHPIPGDHRNESLCGPGDCAAPDRLRDYLLHGTPSVEKPSGKPVTVRASQAGVGQALAYIYGREKKADADIAHVLTMDELGAHSEQC